MKKLKKLRQAGQRPNRAINLKLINYLIYKSQHPTENDPPPSAAKNFLSVDKTVKSKKERDMG
jgi:hypothetical protein